jgi:hypothetical protein
LAKADGNQLISHRAKKTSAAKIILGWTTTNLSLPVSGWNDFQLESRMMPFASKPFHMSKCFRTTIKFYPYPVFIRLIDAATKDDFSNNISAYM